MHSHEIFNNGHNSHLSKKKCETAPESEYD
jgi:hypothetical protein